MIKVSMISIKNIIKNMKRYESFLKKFEKICLILVTVVKEAFKKLFGFVESFLNFWR